MLDTWERAKLNVERNRKRRTARRAAQNMRPATQRQQEYLVSLGVKLEPGMTVARASQLIDAAKNDYLGSIGGAYYDGSN